MPKGKSRKAPQLISDELWATIQAAVCTGGMSPSEAGLRFGVSRQSIEGKAKRNHWPLPSRIHERVLALQRQLPQKQIERNANDSALEIIASSWAEKGETHRQLAFQAAHDALALAVKRGNLPAFEDWKDVDYADKVARRNAGLDDISGHSLNSGGIQLICQRIENQLNISVPPPSSRESPNPNE